MSGSLWDSSVVFNINVPQPPDCGEGGERTKVRGEGFSEWEHKLAQSRLVRHFACSWHATEVQSGVISLRKPQCLQKKRNQRSTKHERRYSLLSIKICLLSSNSTISATWKKKRNSSSWEKPGCRLILSSIFHNCNCRSPCASIQHREIICSKKSGIW